MYEGDVKSKFRNAFLSEKGLYAFPGRLKQSAEYTAFTQDI